MKHKKYVPCSGLAFYDVEDMDRLQAYAKEGWIFRELKGIWYVLYREEPQDLIFSYDMVKIKKADRLDYLRMFEEAGWYPIRCKDTTMHFFYAKPGARALHTESQTSSDQYRTIWHVCLWFLCIGLLLLLPKFLSSSKIVSWLFSIGAGLIGGVSILCIASYLRMKGRRWKLHLTFKQACGICLLGLGLIAVNLWGKYQQLTWIPYDLIKLCGLLAVLTGLIHMMFGFRVYKDKKE